MWSDSHVFLCIVLMKICHQPANQCPTVTALLYSVTECILLCLLVWRMCVCVCGV